MLWHQAISMPSLEHNLISPFSQVYDIVVNNVPKFLLMHPTAEDHTTVVHDPDDTTALLILPLELEGVVSYLPVFLVTQAEFDSGQYSSLI